MPFNVSTQIFNPIDYKFRWTESGYEWDAKAAHEEARKDWLAMDAELREDGLNPDKIIRYNVVITRGGHGTGRPEVTVTVTLYVLAY